MQAWPSVEITQGGDEKKLLYLFYALIYLLFYSYVSLTTLRLVWNTGLGDYTRVLMSQLGAMASGILCLSALGVPYAGGELAHRGFGPTTCPVFN